jgi:valyl-tRNA synthetase
VVRSIEQGGGVGQVQRDNLPLEDRWVLSRLSQTVTEVGGLMEDFQFGEAERQIHDFLWGEFCDWYIEFAKIRLSSDREAPSPLPVLVHVMETSLRLLHPYMPFLTEELWQHLRPHLGWPAPESIMVAPYPEADARAADSRAEQVMSILIEIIRSIRNVRAQYRVESGRWIEAMIYADNLIPALAPYTDTIQNLARARPVTFLKDQRGTPPEENAVSLVLSQVQVFIPMASMFDVEVEKRRMQDEIGQSQAELSRLEARLKDQQFLDKAPPAVIERERQKLYNLVDRLERLKQQMQKF